MSSSSPQRGGRRNDLLSDVPSSSSGLFVGSSRSRPELSGYSSTPYRRRDIGSDGFGPTPNRRRRLFVDANGMPVNEQTVQSDATFSNLNPDTSEADALGGASTRVIWGTNISIADSMSAFKNFLYNYTRKYRLWADGMTEEETIAMGDYAEEKEYMVMMDNMRRLGVTSLNLDVRNLKAYPPTVKLWHQLQAYPQEIIPLMDQSVKDIMVELAMKEMDNLRSQARRNQLRAGDNGFVQPPSSSEPMSEATQPPPPEIPNLVEEVEVKNYKVLPFGLDKTVNMRDLDPAGMCLRAVVATISC